jgi:drug/metabolite transporter (DMT)-like permease
MTAMLALVAAVFYGSTDFLGGFMSKRAPAVSVAVMSQVAGLPMLALLLFIVPTDGVTIADVGWGAAGGLFGGIGVVALYAGLAAGQMAVVAPVAGLVGAGLPVVYSLVTGEWPQAITLVGIALALVAIPGLASGADRGSGGDSLSAISLAVAAGSAFGLFFIFYSFTAEGSGMWPLLGARVVSVPTLYLIARQRQASLRFRGSTRNMVAIVGVLDMAANALMLLALQRGPLAIAATLISLYPGFTVVLARLVLRERLSALQRVSVTLALAAIVLITAP